MQPLLTLDYAQPPPWHRRRRMLRWVALAILATSLMPALWYRQPLWRRANLLYYDWQCRRYTTPPEQLIYSTDPADLTRLAHDPRYSAGRRYDKSPFLLARPPECWVRWCKATGADKQCVRKPGNAIAFLHPLRQKNGQRWLVAFDWSSGTQLSYTLRTDWLSGEVHRGKSRCQGETYNLVGMNLPLRVFAGQVDPADASHFTIRYELAGRSEVIDGWLTDDNNIKLIVPAVERIRSTSAAAR